MNSLFLKFWILLHISVIGLALYGLPWKIEANLTEVLVSGKAEKLWVKNNSSSFAILVGDKEFKTAKNSAVALHNSFSGDSSLENLELFIDGSALDDLRQFFFKNRYNLQSREWLRSLDSGNVGKVKREALARVYGFSIASLENLEQDPFLLGENWLFELENFGNIKIIDDMRTATLDSMNYILITGKLSPTTFSVASDGHILGRIKEEAKLLESQNPGLQIALSGIPFHTYESSANAKREITLITAISMTLVVLLIIYIFRSPFPLFALIATLLTAVLFATSATRLIFGQMHILTFVFGTSLIGVSIDYALHFFVHWRVGGKDGFSVRSQIISCLSLSFLTTMLGYAALMFTPFPLLRQMALFSFAGLLSSFLTVQILFPYIKPVAEEKNRLPFFLANVILTVGKNISGFRIPIFIAAGIIALLGLSRVQLKNDISGFYSMSKEMKRSEYLTARVMNSGSGAFFLVKGSNQEETLVREEALCSGLDNYLALTSFLPSVATQQKIYSSIERNLLLPADSLLLELDFDSSAIYAMRDDFAKSGENFLTDMAQLPAVFRQVAEKLWLGEIDGAYYSIVIPLNSGEKSRYAAISLPGVYFIDKVASVGAELTGISKMALLLMFGVYVFVFALLCFLYGFRMAFGIVSIPMLAAIMAVSFMSLLGLPLNFFAVNGIILTLAIGIDYALFFARSKDNVRVVLLGTFFSMLTTLLSFGTLSFSGFVPVSAFGLSAFFGIFGCFFFSVLLYGKLLYSPNDKRS